ncbi:hypothetical protein AAFF_G00313600 [Aldrovandia affinis]|uniref:Uncharacterized protein n=1 Tax=Aldrovandia affinis TaxID=143900 RepID=A0AAD7SNY8_9TELE|nr:hypothetical protein AAFF_G00313600 [Aldrovandia affinis]
MYWAEDDNMGPKAPCLESHTKPVNNSSYKMYHGTTKSAAENIKRHGFSQSENGMLGPGSPGTTTEVRYGLGTPKCGMVPSGLEEDCVWDPSRIKVTKVIKAKSLPSQSYYDAEDDDGY